ncbi:NXPE family member 3-like [Diadema antillarum]|uniref:NXPE family member 3-like n=1 Tax=Diadema antillarum TaxID=105358 RepID=UPI003A84D910
MTPGTKRAVLVFNTLLVLVLVTGALWVSWTPTGMSALKSAPPILITAGNATRGMETEHPMKVEPEPMPPSFCPRKPEMRAGWSVENLPPLDQPQNPTWTRVADITSHVHSYFTVVNLRPSYRVCDQLELRIQARNGRAEDKSYGGDYFRAKVFTKSAQFNAGSSTDGEVIDHGNGTYSAFFTLKWAGTVSVTVTLIHSSEAVSSIRRFRDAVPARYVYRGNFVSPDGSRREETFCNLVLPNQEKAVCNLTDSRSGSPWFCQRPSSPALSCADWRQSRCDTGAAYRTEIPTMPPIEKLTIIPKHHISGDVQLVQVEDIDVPQEPDQLSETKKAMLPPCTIRSYTDAALEAGYYLNDLWNNPRCTINRLSLSETKACLAGKTLHFLGDSTIRQLFEYYLAKLSPTMQKTSNEPEPVWHVGPTRARDAQFNTSMVFRFHGFPIGRNAWATVKDIHYIANELDDIVADNRTVVVISVWAHFTQQPRWFYENRVRAITSAIDRLLERSPSTFVIVKSANTREHVDVNQLIYHSDWLGRDLDQILRQHTLRKANVAFIDAWDMSSAQLIPDNVHPGGSHVKNLSDQLLTLICKSQ